MSCSQMKDICIWFDFYNGELLFAQMNGDAVGACDFTHPLKNQPRWRRMDGSIDGQTYGWTEGSMDKWLTAEYIQSVVWAVTNGWTVMEVVWHAYLFEISKRENTVNSAGRSVRSSLTNTHFASEWGTTGNCSKLAVRSTRQKWLFIRHQNHHHFVTWPSRNHACPRTYTDMKARWRKATGQYVVQGHFERARTRCVYVSACICVSAAFGFRGCKTA